MPYILKEADNVLVVGRTKSTYLLTIWPVLLRHTVYLSILHNVTGLFHLA